VGALFKEMDAEKDKAASPITTWFYNECENLTSYAPGDVMQTRTVIQFRNKAAHELEEEDVEEAIAAVTSASTKRLLEVMYRNYFNHPFPAE
jgi:hypothetical protein